MSTVVGLEGKVGGADQGLTGSTPNGLAKGQFLSGRLAYFELDAKEDISDFGFEANGAAKAGEVAVQALATIANPVILEPSAESANVLYFVTEVPGIDEALIQAAVRAAGLAAAEVAEGTLSVYVD